jgi:hypothetical protein
MKAVFDTLPHLNADPMCHAFNCAKGFYYDCLDEQRSDEQIADYEIRKKGLEDTFNQIREIPGFHVRLGTLAGRRQKEVDVALAVDMLTHAFYKNMSRAVLIAGDLDFRPLVDSLVRLGTYVEVASAKSNTAKPLQWAADWHRELTFDILYGWTTEEFRQLHPIPQRRNTPEGWVPNGWEAQREGRFHGEQAYLVRIGGEWGIQFRASATSPIEVISSRDRQVLERYFETVCGGAGDSLTWKT